METLRSAILIFILSIAVCSCSKTGVQDIYLLTDEMKNQNPFVGGEKLYYLTDSSVQVVFSASERNNQVHEVPYGQRTNIWDLYEVEKMNFQSEQNSSFYFDMHYNAGYNFYINFYYNNNVRGVRYDLPINKENSVFTDSLLIQNKWYYNIFTSNKDTSAHKLYYSTKYGIVKVEFLDGSYLELEKVEK